MSVFGHPDPPTTAPRALRRLSHSPAVPTTYLSRSVELETDGGGRGGGRPPGVRRRLCRGSGPRRRRWPPACATRRRSGRRRRCRALTRALAAARGGRAQPCGRRSRRPPPSWPSPCSRRSWAGSWRWRPTRDARPSSGCWPSTRGWQPATVRLNPADVEALDARRSRPGRSPWWPTPSVEPGGAVVEIGRATLDGQLGPALERVRQVLLGPDAPERVMTALLDALAEPALAAARPQRYGQVTQMVGMSIEVAGIPAAIGDGLAAAPRRRADPGRGRRAARREGRVPGARRDRRPAGRNTRDRGMGGPLPVRVGPELLGPGARRDRSPDGRGPAIAGCRRVGRGRAAPPAAARHGDRAAAARGAGARRSHPVREGPAARHLRRLGCRQVVAHVDDRPGHGGRRLGGGADR